MESLIHTPLPPPPIQQRHELVVAHVTERRVRPDLDLAPILLFPGRGEGERMVADIRKALDKIGKRAGFPVGTVRPHRFRHTYTAARLQTCDRGRPVSVYSVARELGHQSTSQIEDRYGHLHDRAEEGGTEVVEFRVETYREKLKDRLRSLEASSSNP